MNKVTKLKSIPQTAAPVRPFGFLSDIPVKRLAELPCGALAAIIRTRDPEYHLERDHPGKGEALEFARTEHLDFDGEPWRCDPGIDDPCGECEQCALAEARYASTKLLRNFVRPAFGLSQGSTLTQEICEQLGIRL